MIRFEAAQEADVTRWFADYRHELKTLNIRKRRNILNFDEAGFRIGCMRGQEILVPMEIKQFYAVSLETVDRRRLSRQSMLPATIPPLQWSSYKVMISWPYGFG